MTGDYLVTTWEVSVRHVREMMQRGERILLVDVRQPEEHAISRIEGAMLAPLSELPNYLDTIRNQAVGQTVITFCHHGGRSLNAAAVLRELGIDGVRSMAGGIDAWSIHVDPAVKRY